MDTISRENNSILPIVGTVVGGLAVILSAFALVKLSGVKSELTKLQEDTSARIASVESQVASAAQTAESTKNLASRIQADTNTAFGQVAEQLGSIRGEIAKIQESLTKPKAAAGAAGKAAPVAGPGEYVIKKGDTPSKIASAKGVSREALLKANPKVNWSKLAIGQIIKLPTK